MARRPRLGRAQPVGRVIFTIASANYLAHAATLMQSVRTWHPGERRVIILADAPAPVAGIDLAAELLPCDALGIALLDNMKLWYTCLEFNTAIKPYAFRRLFEQGARQVVYLDPDIELFAPLDAVFAALAEHSIVLTPHITEPLRDDAHPDDLAILRSGAYNLGFFAARADADAARLIDWWAGRTFLHCRVDVSAGFFTDQRWMDLAPCFVARALILRDPAYNVAYWNIAHRRVQNAAPGQWRVDGGRLVFYHFSGLAPDDPGVFSRHQTRFEMGDLGAVATLCEAYHRRLAANSWQVMSQIPYAYGVFADGRRIEDPMRRWLLRAADAGVIDPQAALAIDPDYFDVADESLTARGVVMTRMMHQLWLDRPDLRGAFDIQSPGGRDAYYAWFTGPHAGVDARSVDAARVLAAGLAWRSPAGLGPPWPAVASESWLGAANQAGQYLGEDVGFALDGQSVILPRQLALMWESRADLRRVYQFPTIGSFHDFIGWAITAGCLESGLDAGLFSAGFLAGLAADDPLTPGSGDVPITVALYATRKVALRRDYLDHWEGFPDTRLGRLAHGLWFAYVAPRYFGWPAALTAPVRAWFEQPGAYGLAGFRFNRAACALWELRGDLQHAFALSDPRSCWGFLHWLCTDGLRELQLSPDAFDPRLRDFLAPAPDGAPVSDRVFEMIYHARADLRAAYDVGDEESGRAGLRRWLDQEFSAAYGALPLGALHRAAAPGSPAVTARVRIALIGQWRAPSGRGEDVRGSAAALDAVGWSDYVVVDRDSGEILRPGGEAWPPGTQLQAATAIVHLNADTALQDWAFLRRLGVQADRSIGFWAWELEFLPRAWRHAFSFYDEIWAPTRFAQAAFAREALRPVRLVPMTVSLPPLADDGPGDASGVAGRRARAAGAKSPGARPTVFFFMFDFRSFVSRKNPEAVIAAFRQAFPTGQENVRLLIKTQASASAAAAWRRLHHLAADPRIELRDTTLSRQAVLAMMAEADVFVSLHRSEGFGRGPAEAMLLERPVIATLYSGTEDFLSDNCAYVVGATMRPVRPDEYPGAEGQNWAEPDIAAAAAHMRRCHEHPKAAAAVGRRGAARVRELYHPARVGHAILTALGEADRNRPLRSSRG